MLFLPCEMPTLIAIPSNKLKPILIAFLPVFLASNLKLGGFFCGSQAQHYSAQTAQNNLGYFELFVLLVAVLRLS